MTSHSRGVDMELNDERIVAARARCIAGKGLNNFIMLTQRHGDIEHMNDACYASLLYQSQQLESFVDYPFGKLRLRDYPDEEVLHRYLKYILQDSPWHRAFRTKSPKDVLKNAVVFDVNRPTTYVVQGGILLRATAEDPERVQAWAEISKACPHNLALLMAREHRIVADPDETVIGIERCMRNDNEHYAITSRFINKEVLRLWEGRTVLPRKDSLMRNTQFYKKVKTYWCYEPVAEWKTSENFYREEFYEVWGEKCRRYYIPSKNIGEYVQEYIKLNDLGDIYA